MRKVGRGVTVGAGVGWRLSGWESVRVSLVVVPLRLVGSNDGSGIDRGGRARVRVGGRDGRSRMKVGLGGEELGGRVDLGSGSVDVEVS